MCRWYGFNYKKYNAYSNVQAGNLKYEEIAPVYDCVSSFSWEDDYSCKKITEKALANIETKAKQLGGNGIVNVKWSKSIIDKNMYNYPVCGNGFIRVNTCVSGTAIKFINKDKK